MDAAHEQVSDAKVPAPYLDSPYTMQPNKRGTGEPTMDIDVETTMLLSALHSLTLIAMGIHFG
jgi:hypothetical protein